MSRCGVFYRPTRGNPVLRHNREQAVQMKLMPPEQAPSGLLVREFRDVSWRGLLIAGAVFAAIAVFVALPKSGGPAWGAAMLPFLLSALCVSLALSRRMNRNGAWLVKYAADGLYINTNNGDGYPLPGPRENILFFPPAMVACLTPVQEVMRLPHRFGATRHHFSCLDVTVRQPVPVEILAGIRMQQERFRKAGKTGPYPIRMVTPSRMRLNWGWIHPGAKEAVRKLSDIFATGPPRAIVYPDWDTLSEAQKECYLDELWRMGMITESLFLGRAHLGRSSRQVRDLLEGRNRRE